MERTLVIVKPDGVARGLIGQVLCRIEAKGYSITDIRMLHPDRKLVEEHYSEHRNRSFYSALIEFMTSGPVVIAQVEGHEVVTGLRSVLGATDPTLAAPGSIRGDFGRSWGPGAVRNIVHASDSAAAAQRELDIWFPRPVLDDKTNIN